MVRYVLVSDITDDMTFKKGAMLWKKRYTILMCSAHLCLQTETKTASEPLTSTLLILLALVLHLFVNPLLFWHQYLGAGPKLAPNDAICIR